jgi:hypothetical protein
VCLGHCCNYYNGAITIIMYMYTGTVTGDNYSVLGTMRSVILQVTTRWHFCDAMFRNLLLRCSYLILLNNDAPL